MTIYQFFASAAKIYYSSARCRCRANKTRKGKYSNNNFFIKNYKNEETK
jgi:hypothetical protein